MKKLIGLALVALLGTALPAKDIEVMAVYYPHWHKYPKGMEWFGEKWDWSEAEWAFVKDPVVRFPGQINFKPFGGYYSGSDPKDVATEIALASNAGIDVFLYDYYWYDGEKTQEEAIEQGFLKAKNRDKMKFALMWCYHDPTGRNPPGARSSEASRRTACGSRASRRSSWGSSTTRSRITSTSPSTGGTTARYSSPSTMRGT